MRHKQIRTIVLFLLAVAYVAGLTACGFKFRGAQTFPAEYKYALIQGTAEFSPLGKLLRQYIGSSGLNLTTSMSVADMVLFVKQDEFKRRVLSVNASGGANEYELTYDLVMQANDRQGKVLAEKMAVSMVRNYNFDPNNVLAKSDEETTVKTQMQQLAVRQVLRQLSIQLTRNKPAVKSENETAPSMQPDASGEQQSQGQ